MNVHDYIFKYLQKHQLVALPHFGKLSLVDVPSKLDSETSSILPPGKEIYFHDDAEIQDEGLIDFIQAKAGIDKQKAESELLGVINSWKDQVNEKGEFFDETFGKFYKSGSQISLNGKRFYSDSPENYGLEEINLSTIKNKKNKTVAANEQENYKFNNSILWLFLLIIPIAGMVFLAFTQSQKLFGKKSFENLSAQNATHRIENVKPKMDSLQKRVNKDSIKIDSAKHTIPIAK